MKTYRMVVKYNYYAVVEKEAESRTDFREMVDNMFNNEICGADMIPVSELDIDYESYGEVEEVK